MLTKTRIVKKMTMKAITDRLASGIGTEDAQLLASLVFPFNPVPASRPRVTRWGTYYGKAYKAWKAQAERFIPHGGLCLDAATPLKIMLEFIVQRPKTSKLALPKGDIDNYAKGPLDALTKAGGYWHDDRQVKTLIASKRFAIKAEKPCTKIWIFTCD